MKPGIRVLLFAMYATLSLLGCSQPETKTAGQPGVEQAVSDAVEAYIYDFFNRLNHSPNWRKWSVGRVMHFVPLLDI
jgi:hypothetical protein